MRNARCHPDPPGGVIAYALAAPGRMEAELDVRVVRHGAFSFPQVPAYMRWSVALRPQRGNKTKEIYIFFFNTENIAFVHDIPRL